MTTSMQATQLISATALEAWSPGWDKVPGVQVDGPRITIDPAQYFFRYENPSWLVVPWQNVEKDILPAQETKEQSLEQVVLDYVNEHGVETSDAAQVIDTASHVYSEVFNDRWVSHDPELEATGVTTAHLKMLREMATLMALNRVDEFGHPCNVGPAWFFPVLCEKVFGLSHEEAEFVDDLYHGSFYNEERRVLSVRAHAALGGRLVHGCQSAPCMAGGAIVPYGASIDTFMKELGSFKNEWMDRIREY